MKRTSKTDLQATPIVAQESEDTSWAHETVDIDHVLSLSHYCHYQGCLEEMILTLQEYNSLKRHLAELRRVTWASDQEERGAAA